MSLHPQVLCPIPEEQAGTRVLALQVQQRRSCPTARPSGA